MNDDRVKDLLKRALPPVGEAEPARDLWPAMLRKIDEPARALSMLDAALLAAVIAWIVFDPTGALALLYHL